MYYFSLWYRVGGRSLKSGGERSLFLSAIWILPPDGSISCSPALRLLSKTQAELCVWDSRKHAPTQQIACIVMIMDMLERKHYHAWHQLQSTLIVFTQKFTLSLSVYDFVLIISGSWWEEARESQDTYTDMADIPILELCCIKPIPHRFKLIEKNILEEMFS